MRVLITGARAPSALHFARLLAGAGLTPVLGECMRFPLGRFTGDGFDTCRYPSPRWETEAFCDWVRETVRKGEANLVVPICEEAVYLATLLKTELGDALATPSGEVVRSAHSKRGFIAQLRCIGLNAPRTRAFVPGNRISEKTVIKPVWTRFGSEVLLRPTQEEADRLDGGRAWVEQDMVEGTEICGTAFCHNGRIAAFAGYRPRQRSGSGAGLYFERIETPALLDAMSRYARFFGWEGFLSFDAIEDGDGAIWPIECNPRATSGVHLWDDGAALVHAVEGNATYFGTTAAAAVKPAVWLARLARPRRGQPSLRGAQCGLGWRALPNALVTGAELFLDSRRKRISLLEALTDDIQWEQRNVQA